MTNTLYLECYAGISGDMIVAALLDLGAERTTLRRALDSLEIKGFTIDISQIKKEGIEVCDFSVNLEQNIDNHDHDMDYLYGREKKKDPVAKHVYKNRRLPDILKIIEKADMTAKAKEKAVHMITILAQAEAKAHGIERDQVEFHEVGAVDTIVDLVAAAVCLEQLDITEIIVPKLYDGKGTVRCQKGLLPVPVPAVVNILQEYQIPLQITEIEGELITPTGAAIVAAVRTREVLPEQFTITKIGVGAGKRSYHSSGVLRAMLLEEASVEEDTIYQLEANIDDCSGEVLGYAMKQLFMAGARDVYYMPIFMKKNRPAYQLHVICKEGDRKRLEQIIFEETTTIGIRRAKMKRSILKRRIEYIETPLGEAIVKVCTLPNGREKWYPEYESVVSLAEKHAIRFQKAYDMIKSCQNHK